MASIQVEILLNPPKCVLGGNISVDGPQIYSHAIVLYKSILSVSGLQAAKNKKYPHILTNVHSRNLALRISEARESIDFVITRMARTEFILDTLKIYKFAKSIKFKNLLDLSSHLNMTNINKTLFSTR